MTTPPPGTKQTAPHPNPREYTVTPVREGDTISLPTTDGSGFVRTTVPRDGLYIEMHDSALYIDVDSVEQALAKLR